MGQYVVIYDEQYVHKLYKSTKNTLVKYLVYNYCLLEYKNRGKLFLSSKNILIDFCEPAKL